MLPRLSRRLLSIPLGYGVTLVLITTVIAVSIISNRAALIALVASSASSLDGHTAVAFFTPYEDDILTLGETTNVDVRINAGVPVNAVGATVHFPSDMLEVVAISKERSFLDLWTEETVIREEPGEVRFSGGTLTSGGHIGVATVLTLSLRARQTGRAEISFKDLEIYAHDGRGETVESDTRTLAFEIQEKPAEVPAASAPREITIAAEIRPSADFNNDGRTSLADMSILAIQLFSSYNARFDLDRDGSLNLKDMSILFTKLRD